MLPVRHRYLVPAVSGRSLIAASVAALAGALAAAIFGILHDQISYTLSPEYFTRMKFGQFGLDDRDVPDRLLAAWVGLSGSWWVGLIAGWFFGRVIWRKSRARQMPDLWQAFGIMLLAAAAGGFTASFAGIPGTGRAWLELADELGVSDVGGFVRVCHLHLGTYLGAGVGFCVAIIRLIRSYGSRRKRGGSA